MQQQSLSSAATVARRPRAPRPGRRPRWHPGGWAARELHDCIGSELAVVLRQLELTQACLTKQDPEAAARLLTGSLRAVDEAMRVTRELAVELAALGEYRTRRLPVRSPGLEGPSLAEGLSAFVIALKPSGTQVRLDLGGLPAALPTAPARQLRRILCEALRNAFTHSGADLVELRVTGTAEALTAEVEDNGKGFDPAAAHGADGSGEDGLAGLGLASMRQRAQALGGAVAIVSAPGLGTRVTVRLPLPAPMPVPAPVLVPLAPATDGVLS